MNKEIAEKGKEGEDAMNDWLKANGLSFVAVCQEPTTFAPLFTYDLKRPDFLLLLESVGLIAIDAKNYKQSEGGGYTLKLETELRRAVAFERLFRIPIWYAYFSKENEKIVWYWISALKAIEVGQSQTNGTTYEDFLTIKIDHFEKIESNADLGKLYTQRLPSLSRIKNI